MNVMQRFGLALVLSVGIPAPPVVPKFVVFFPARLYNLTAEADAVVSDAIEVCGVTAHFAIRAQADISDCHADPAIAVGGCELLYAEDPNNANLLRDYQAMSEHRASAVAYSLVAKGASERQIERRGIGLVTAPDELGDGPPNRRATIECRRR